MGAAGAQAEHRYDVVSRSNKFRKPVSLPPTPVDDERNAIDHHPSPSSLKTAVAWFASLTFWEMSSIDQHVGHRRARILRRIECFMPSIRILWRRCYARRKFKFPGSIDRCGKFEQGSS
jgi:hypothetical protein